MLSIPLGLLSERRESNPHGCSYHPAPPKGAASTLPPLSVRLSVFARYGPGLHPRPRSPIHGHYQAPSQIGLNSRRTEPSVRRRHLLLHVFHPRYQIGLSQSDSLPMPRTFRQRLWQFGFPLPTDAESIARSEACPRAILGGAAFLSRRNPFPGSPAQVLGLFDLRAAYPPWEASIRHLGARIDAFLQLRNQVRLPRYATDFGVRI